MHIIAIVATLLLAAPPAPAVDEGPAILPLSERAEVINNWLKIRLDTVVPMLMRREGIDMWMIVAREYNEDPVIESMLPGTSFAARRRTILLFYDRGGEEGIERLTVSRYGIGDYFNSEWKPEEQPDQWKRLAELIAERDPQKIAINRSDAFALADGITLSQYEEFVAALDEKYRSRIVSGEKLAVGWLETRIPAEMVVYPAIVSIAHSIIADGMSEMVIQPGVTTTDDVRWWYRERIKELKLDTWFHPSVDIQRAGAMRDGSAESRAAMQLIMPGDLLHIDFGITYLRLNTDTQRHAYVLKSGETDAPQGIKDALKTCNRLQDILMSQFKAGRTGNEILKAALDQAKAEGIKPSIYTHPLGFHGHAAGPTIGLWDRQDGVPGQGDYPLYPNTAYSIELNAAVAIPEWESQEVRIMLEEDAFFDGENTTFIAPRQTEPYLIPRQK